MTSVAINCDILALCSIDKYCVIGIGNQIRIYNTSTLNPESVINTLHHDKIHDIRKCDNHLVVFGGRCLSIFQFYLTNGTIRLEKESTHYFNDWIIAAEFFSQKNYENLYILFAHNNVYLYNTFNKKSINVWCEEKCILYSGCISTEKSDEATIFSGTVFQEILIWTVSQNAFSFDDTPVLWRLKDHKGVIFSIFYDPLQKLISSTSDDRTVKLWKITNSDKKSTEPVDWKNAKIVLKNTMYGHTARVWKSIIVNHNIISIGEDSQLCTWTLDGNLCNNIVAHDGATIWNIAITEDKSSLITSGANGAVSIWPFCPYQIDSSLIPKSAFLKNQLPKYVAYLRSGTFLVFMDDGTLLVYNTNMTNLKSSLNLSEFKDYCLMQISPNRSQIAFASKHGIINIFDEERNNNFEANLKIEKKIIDSKIFAVHWLSDDLLLICGHNGHLEIFEITMNNGLISKFVFILPESRERWTTAAVLMENILICSARNGNIYVYSTYDETMDEASEKTNQYPSQILYKVHGHLGVQSFDKIHEKLISVGRDGFLKYYEHRKKNDKVNQQNALHPKYYLKPLYSKKLPMEWISKIFKTADDIYIMGFKEVEFMIYSINLQRLIIKFVCGGGHRSWDCIFSNGFLNFSCIRNKQVYILDNIPSDFSRTIVQGFHTKEIHSIKFLPTISNKNIFVSASEDCTIRISTLKPLNVNSNFSFNFNSRKFDERKEYQNEIVCLETLDGHISNVKCLDVVNVFNSETKTENLVFSGGGRAQIKIWRITIDTSHEELRRNHVNIVEIDSFMLRETEGNSKKIKEKKFERKQEFYVDPETRFMDVNAIPLKNIINKSENIIKNVEDIDDVILFVACSDGFIRIYSNSVRQMPNGVNFIEAIPYNNRCVIKIITFFYDSQVILISMATDGIVNLWSLKRILERFYDHKNNDDICGDEKHGFDLKPFEQWNLHQSGINSCDFKRHEKDGLIFLLTGGDDNKICLSVFSILVDENERVSAITLGSWGSSSMHFAQITGVQFYDQKKFLSVAIDQRIVQYEYSYNNKILTVTPMKKVILTSIADVHGLTFIHNLSNNKKDSFACVYGRGLEVILFGNDDKTNLHT